MGRLFNPRAGDRLRDARPAPYTIKSTYIQRCRADALTRPWGTEPVRATFQRSGTIQVRWYPGRGRCGQAQRAPRKPPHRRKRQGGQARRGVPAARPAPRAPAPPRLAMVEQGDAAPLLRWAEGPAVSVPQDPALQAGGWVRGGSGGGRVAAEAPRRREPDEPAPPEVLLQPGRLELGDVEEDQVVAVFVVTFDPRSGESRLGMEGWGGRVAGGRLHTGFRGRGGGTRCARTRTHTPASLPAWGSRGTGALCRPIGAEGSRGLCSAPCSVPPRLSAPLRLVAALLFAPLQCGRIGLQQRAHWLLFSVFLLGWKVLLDTERTEPPSLPRMSPPKRVQNDPALRLPLLRVAPCAVTFPAA